MGPPGPRFVPTSMNDNTLSLSSESVRNPL